MASNKWVVFNFVSFQLWWWACILSAKPGLGWAVLLLMIAACCVHLQWIESWRHALPLLITTLLGCILDQIAYNLGWLSFEHHHTWPAFIPLWMIALWLAFSMTLNVSMRWLQGRTILAAILGGMFGPLAYLGAQQLKVIDLPSSSWSLLWVTVEWAVAMPLLLWIRRRFNETLSTGPT
ncbi:DUF2878 domain-containing protein [Methylophilus sp. UBA6697]|jgi:hypothetical protein|uniref:DUF2878 domain-containing protein n=1 Tax=Methylophilus sp. UBA6697 TaxID=1946902 RepID=UPI0025DADE50|nr:DUF2878 domain-containing protein [Methylophilus sp. UBA6697]